MKAFLLLVVAVALCHANDEENLKVPKIDFNYDWINNCCDECGVPNDEKSRAPYLNFKSSVFDLCYVKCGARLFNVLHDHYIRTDYVERMFTMNGLDKPVSLELLTDLSDTDPNFVSRIAEWSDKNKQLFFSLQGVFEKYKEKIKIKDSL